MNINLELFYWDYLWFIWAGIAVAITAATFIWRWLKRRRMEADIARRAAEELRRLPDPIEALLRYRHDDITKHNPTAEDRQFHVNELRFAVRWMSDLGIDAPGPEPLRDVMVKMVEGETADAEKFVAWYANENRDANDGETETVAADMTHRDEDHLEDHEINPFAAGSAADASLEDGDLEEGGREDNLPPLPGEDSSPEKDQDPTAITEMPDFHVADAARVLAAFVLLRDDDKTLRCYKLAVKKSDDDIGHLLRLGQFTMRSGDLPKARKPLAEALEIAEAIDDHEGIARAKLALGRLSQKRGQSRKALRYMQAAADYADEAQIRDIGALAHRGLGECELQRKDYDKALEELHQALTLEQMLGFNDSMATTHRRIGQVQIELGDFEKANAELRTARQLLEVLNEKPDLLAVMRDEAILRNRQKDYEGSIEAFDEALTLAREIKQHGFFADLLGEKAQIHLRLREHQQSEALYGRAILMNQKLKRHDAQANICKLLAELYEKQGEFAKAIGVAREAERLHKAEKNVEKSLTMTSWIGRMRAEL